MVDYFAPPNEAVASEPGGPPPPRDDPATNAKALAPIGKALAPMGEDLSPLCEDLSTMSEQAAEGEFHSMFIAEPVILNCFPPVLCGTPTTIYQCPILSGPARAGMRTRIDSQLRLLKQFRVILLLRVCLWSPLEGSDFLLCGHVDPLPGQ